MSGGTVDDCEIDNNRQWYARGEHASAMYIASPNALVTNCVIRSNTSYGGSTADYRSGAGAIWLADGLVVDCLISNNTAYGAYGGGGYVSGGTLRNTILYYNTSASGTGHNLTSTNGVTFSCAPELTLGEGNTTVEPWFENPAIGNYDLSVYSPSAIDAGTNLLWMADAVDLAGMPRIQNKRVDMGAYESRRPNRGSMIMIRYVELMERGEK